MSPGNPRPDRELLKAVARRDPEGFHALLHQYLRLVWGIAFRQLEDPGLAEEVTAAVFVTLVAIAHRLPRKTPLASWLLETTLSSVKRCRKLARAQGRSALPLRPMESGPTPDAEVWDSVGPVLDRAVQRLSAKVRVVVLLRCFLGLSVEEAATVLRARKRRIQKRAERGQARLLRRLRRWNRDLDAGRLEASLGQHACGIVPEGVFQRVLEGTKDSYGRRPREPLARRTFGAAAWRRWRQLFRVPAYGLALLLALVGFVAATMATLWKTGYLLPLIVEISSRAQLRQMPELAEPAQPWEPTRATTPAVAAVAQRADELYQTGRIWMAHITFSQTEWAKVQPNRVPPVKDLLGQDGTVTLRNPKAQRNGIAGALGFDYDWASGSCEVGGVRFTNVAIRMRGNGTYLSARHKSKNSWKVDLDKFQSDQGWKDLKTLNFLNMIEDRSYMHDALGYEIFASAAVPTPRTSYAWMTLSVDGQWTRKPLGLYLLVENVDSRFGVARFGSKKTAIFKPVTPTLFKDLGNDWAAYQPVYDPKTKISTQHEQQVIRFSQLLTHAGDEEFVRRVGEFLDLEEFARFMAALVLVANYDSLLSYGQNYYMYLDPRTEKFGFIPWDLDQAWGSFPHFGSAAARERNNLWHPWIGPNRFLERVFQVPEFQRLYRQALDQLLTRSFVPESLGRRIDEIAGQIRPAVAAESKFRLRLFDQAISDQWLPGERDGGDGPGRPVHQLKRFISQRAKSARQQLNGRSRGVQLEANGDWE